MSRLIVAGQRTRQRWIVGVGKGMQEDVFTSPSSARIYDYLLGGKDNYQIDRDAAHQMIDMGMDTRLIARTNREFMRRVIAELAGTMGIRQFLDIGTGIPTPPNLHQIAQDIFLDAHVVYVGAPGSPSRPVAVRPGRARRPAAGNSCAAWSRGGSTSPD